MHELLRRRKKEEINASILVFLKRSNFNIKVVNANSDFFVLYFTYTRSSTQTVKLYFTNNEMRIAYALYEFIFCFHCHSLNCHDLKATANCTIYYDIYPTGTLVELYAEVKNIRLYVCTSQSSSVSICMVRRYESCYHSQFAICVLNTVFFKCSKYAVKEGWWRHNDCESIATQM